MRLYMYKTLTMKHVQYVVEYIDSSTILYWMLLHYDVTVVTCRSTAKQQQNIEQQENKSLLHNIILKQCND